MRGPRLITALLIALLFQLVLRHLQFPKLRTEINTAHPEQRAAQASDEADELARQGRAIGDRGREWRRLQHQSPDYEKYRHLVAICASAIIINNASQNGLCATPNRTPWQCS